MTKPIDSLDIPKEPAVRRAWVVYQLRLRGLSLRSLAQEIGVTHTAVGFALVSPNSHIEPVLADALGLRVEDLFPERFDASGRRLHKTREQQRTSLARGGNGKGREAA